MNGLNGPNAQPFIPVVRLSLASTFHFQFCTMSNYTPRKKMFNVQRHEYLAGFPAHENESGGSKLRERVATCLNVGSATVGRVIAHWNANMDPYARNITGRNFGA